MKPPKPPGTDPPVVPGETPKNPFLKEFLVVYEGDWVLVTNAGGAFYSIGISKEPSTCSEDEKECCGALKVSQFGSNATEATYLFCLTSTYEIHIRDVLRVQDLMCIGVKGARMPSPLHPALEGWAIDDPTCIECGTFRLIRPE